ncbi:MAG: insulinase family protein [Bacilli bacterium]|nr:insulinase family protein [Bacilli bacterium]
MDLSKLINDNGVYLYQDDSFNTIIMQLCFNSKNGNREDAINYVLCKYLMHSNEVHESTAKRMKELYSAEVWFSPQKIGKISNILLCVDLVSPSVVEDDYLEDAFKFVSDILLHPDFTDNEQLEIIKRSYISDLLHRISNSGNRASRLFLDSVFEDENNKYGCSVDKEYIKNTINSITMDDIKEAYYNTINENSFYRGIVFGNISTDEFKLLRKIIPYKNNKGVIDHSPQPNIVEGDSEVSDSDINESILYVTYEIDDIDEGLTKILGSIFNGRNGLCHQILREKYGLVYSSYVSIFYYRKAFVFKAKIDKNNKQKTLDAINEIISIAQDKTKLIDLLKYAKEYIKTEDYLLSENKIDMVDYLDDYIRGIAGDFNYSEFIKNLDSYTEEDIASHMKSLRLKNIFMYKGDKNA